MNVFNEQQGQITLYAHPGLRESITTAILLEILRQPYNIRIVHSVEAIDDVNARETATSLPAIVDIADSGAKKILNGSEITEYLLQHYDGEHQFSYKTGSREATEVNSWVSFLLETLEGSDAANILSSGETPLARKVLRLYLNVEQHLQETRTRYIVGNKLTLADLVVFPIAATADSFGLDLERFPEVTGWYNRLMSEYPMRKAMAGLDPA
ncbi:glutathione S-transferase [Aspergillus falconensis]